MRVRTSLGSDLFKVINIGSNPIASTKKYNSFIISVMIFKLVKLRPFSGFSGYSLKSTNGELPKLVKGRHC